MEAGNGWEGDAMMQDWMRRPLGIAVVDETEGGGLAVMHVSVSVDGVTQSGAWHFPSATAEDLSPRLAHWVVIGTRDGVNQTEELIGEQVATGDLASLVAAAEEAEVELVQAWEAYKEEAPLKRANLVELNARSWPSITEDGEAADILRRVNRQPYSDGTPELMRDSIALTRLVSYVLDSWWNLETERLSRNYLNEGDKARRLLPIQWVADNPPWWPRTVA